jgi:MFS family permease
VIARSAAASLPRTGVRPLLLAGSACFLAGFGWLARADADSGYVTSVLGPTLLIAVGIGLTFPTLMAAATADVPAGDAGIIGGLANTASQVGGSIGLAVLATAASARAGTEAGGGGSPAALASGYDLVFLTAAGLGLAIAVVSLLLPQERAAARRKVARGDEHAPDAERIRVEPHPTATSTGGLMTSVTDSKGEAVRGQAAMIEIPAADPTQGREFYGDLFDRQFEAAPGRFEHHTTQIREQTGARYRHRP